nr:uncharacterized protein LOC123761345 [Procambarus clarkii]
MFIQCSPIVNMAPLLFTGSILQFLPYRSLQFGCHESSAGVATSRQRGVATSLQRGVATSRQRGVATSRQRGVATSRQRGVATSRHQVLPRVTRCCHESPAR